MGFDCGCSRFVFNKIHKAKTERLDLFLGLFFDLGFFFRFFFFITLFIFSDYRRFLLFFGILFLFLLHVPALLTADSLRYGSTSNFAELRKFLHQTLVVPIQWNILHVAVGEVVLSRALVSADEMSHLNFLSIN